MKHLQWKAVHTIPMLTGNSDLAASTGVIWSVAIFTNCQKNQSTRGTQNHDIDVWWKFP